MTPLTSASSSATSLSRPNEALQAKAAARRAECCDHDAKAESRRDDARRSDGPGRSPLLKALVQALREVLAAPTSTTGAAETAATGDGAKATASAKSASGAVSTAAAKAAKAAAAAKAGDTAGAAEAVKTEAAVTDAAAEADKTPAAAGGNALEQALTAFARALMQALRGGDEGHRGRGHHHGHHFGRREGTGWGDDPAQRLDRLASMVAQAALGTAPAKPAPASSSATSSSAASSSSASSSSASGSTAGSTSAAASQAAAATPDGTGATQVTTQTAAAPAPAPVTLMLEIRLVPGVSSASPWARAANDLVGAFGSLQQALGRSTAADDEGSVREQLSTFLRNLAARVRGDEAAMSEVEPTRPGALLSVTA